MLKNLAKKLTNNLGLKVLKEEMERIFLNDKISFI